MSLKRTILHPEHVRLNARMVEFGGWDMPVQYGGVLQEHKAVREKVGMFDVSHMGQFRFRGAGALDFLQSITPNDVSKLKVGRAQYNMLPNASGGLVDDIYIYHTAPEEYLMVVNAANIAKDFDHIQHLLQGDVVLTNESDDWALIAVQGKTAEAVLQPHINTDLSKKKKNSVFSAELFAVSVMLARTGYTGEDGFEIFVNNENAAVIWSKLLELGVIPCGLGSRDTLRLEAGFPLYGHEFSETLNPMTTHYTWVFKDKAYHGKNALLDTLPEKILIGLSLDKVPAREGYAIKAEGKVVGAVTSGSQSPTLGHPIAMGYVDLDAVQKPLTIEVRGKDIPAKRVEIPFIKESI